MAKNTNDFKLIIPSKKHEQGILETANSIDLFDATDLETIKELWDEFISKGDDESWYHFLAAEQSGEIHGFACYGRRALTDGTFDLYWIATRKNQHRRGIGSFLLSQVESKVVERGGNLLIAETSGKPEFKSTRDFYLGAGFILEGRIKDFYRKDDDLCIFTRHFQYDQT